MATTIDKVVRSANVEAGYKNLRHYLLFLHFAFDALYKMKRDNVMLGFRFISLPVVNRRATIPSTVLAMGQIGWQRGQRIVPSVVDPYLSLDPAATPSDAYTGFYNNIRYRIDRSVNPNVIILDRQPTENVIYVEVIERTATPTTETIVSDEGVLPMKSYIHYRFARFKTGAASAESKEAEKEYLDEMDEAMAGLSDLSPGGIYFALVKKMGQAGNQYPFYFGISGQ